MTGKHSRDSCRNASKSAIRKAKAEYFEGICHDVARNPSRTWKQLNKVLGRSHAQRVSMLKSTIGVNVFDDGAIAEEFSQFYANCGTCNPNVRGQPTMMARASCQFGLKCIDDIRSVETAGDSQGNRYGRHFL